MEKTRISDKVEVEAIPIVQLQELTKNVTRTEKDFDGRYLYLYKDLFWCPTHTFESINSFRDHFQAKDTDIILATALKSGTTWLKALTFTITNRAKFSPNTENVNPLLISNAHDLVLNFEFHIYMKNQSPNLDHLPSPRLLQTHLPFSALPLSILNSKCRIVHICRNPLDQFVSYWHFFIKRFKKDHIDDDTIEMPCINEAFEMFCKGVHRFGPFWENALGFYRASIENPERVLFLKYEDLKDDINSQVKKIAKFLGFDFSIEEEKQGVIEEIANICSFENLKNLQVNKEGQLENLQVKGGQLENLQVKEGGQLLNVMNSSFFRKGQVGDWVNYISPSQAKRLEDITKQKLDGSGLIFKTFCD